MLYLPSPSQWASGHMKTIFSVSAFHRAVGSGLVQGRRNTSWFNFLNYIMDHGWCHEMLTTCIFYVDTWREICMQYLIVIISFRRVAEFTIIHRVRYRYTDRYYASGNISRLGNIKAFCQELNIKTNDGTVSINHQFTSSSR